VPIKIRRHARAKHFVLRVSGGVIQLTIPTRARLKDAGAWVLEKTDFVERELANAPEPQPYNEGLVLPVLGQERRIRMGGPRGGVLTETELHVTDLAQCERLIRKAAKTAFEREAGHYWDQLDVPPAPITLKSMKRRWGSCAADGSTVFNWRLAFAPYEVLRYVVAHEAVHRIHMDHSPAFWRVVKGISPGYRAHEEWLKIRGAELFAYGR